MFSIFSLAIKLDCLFWAIFQSFHLFVSCMFDELASPLNICLNKCCKSLFSSFQCIQQSQKCQKRVFFLILHFGRHANEGAIALPPAPAGYATASNIHSSYRYKPVCTGNTCCVLARVLSKKAKKGALFCGK